jgi:prevent-host-death family protein
MSEIGAYEAKTHLPKLLERVQNGESFVITRHGRPIAQLVPIARHDPDKVRNAIEGLKQFARQHSLKGLRLKDLIAEGRR